MNQAHCIPADPDISGIGVRTAIYAQNLLSFVPALWALSDGKVTVGELESVEAQSVTILITAFAILVSAIVQALTIRLHNFHAAIILDLSWMNNTNTFIYFLLFIRHKYDTGNDMELNWSAWFTLLRQSILPSPSPSSAVANQTRPNVEAIPHRRNQRFFTRMVFFLGSIHLTVMAAVGLWLWSRPSGFSPSSHCILEATVLFGSASFLSQGLRLFSLFIYSLFLLPFLNLLLPVCGFLALVIHWPQLS